MVYTVLAAEHDSFKKISPAIDDCFKILVAHDLTHGEAELLCKYLLQRITSLAKEKSLSAN